jgi:hypothetical protein
MAASADAAVLYSGLQNLTTPDGRPYDCTSSSYGCSGSERIELDLDGDSIADLAAVIEFGSSDGSVTTSTIRLEGSVAIVPPNPPSRKIAKQFASGSTIGASETWSSRGDLWQFNGNNSASWEVDRTGFAGVRKGNNFGWLRVQVVRSQGNLELRVADWAYETEPGEPISIPVPEPPVPGAVGIGVLALGYLGVRRNRQERKSQVGGDHRHDLTEGGLGVKAAPRS